MQVGWAATLRGVGQLRSPAAPEQAKTDVAQCFALSHRNAIMRKYRVSGLGPPRGGRRLRRLQGALCGAAAHPAHCHGSLLRSYSQMQQMTQLSPGESSSSFHVRLVLSLAACAVAGGCLSTKGSMQLQGDRGHSARGAPRPGMACYWLACAAARPKALGADIGAATGFGAEHLCWASAASCPCLHGPPGSATGQEHHCTMAVSGI